MQIRADNLSCNKDGNGRPPPQQLGSRSSPPTQPKPNTGFAQRHRKPTDNGPKIKKLKYHQYIPPDQRGDKEPPPCPDSSSSSILQQQQLFLQLLVLSQQQQRCSRPPSRHSPSRHQKDQLEEMKVADLRSELKLRSLPVYGPKMDLVQRLRAYEEASGGGSTGSPPAGGTSGPGAEGAAATSTRTRQSPQCHQTPDARSRGRRLAGASVQASSSISSNPAWRTLPLPSSLQPSFPAHSRQTAAPLAADKDQMLRQKDEQIEELTRMLRQEQKLVEALEKQLERGRCGQAPDPLLLLRVQREPPDVPRVVRWCGPALRCLSPPVKQEAASETALKLPHACELPAFLSRQGQKRIVPRIRLEHANPKEAMPSSTMENRPLGHQGSAQSRRQNQTKCHRAQQQILPKPLPLKTRNSKQIKLLINLKQRQVKIQKYPQVQRLWPQYGPKGDSGTSLATNGNPVPRAPTPGVTAKQRPKAADASQLLPPRPIPPCCHPQPAAAEVEPLSSHGSGRLEDFLESTTGKPLLGAEPDGLLALIVDLHSQMLCTPSILDPPSPMDSFDASAEVQPGVKINDWLDLNMGGETDEDTLAPLGQQTPCGIFSTDSLESCMIL